MTDSWTSGTFECETQRKDGKRVCAGPKGGKAWVLHTHTHTHADVHTHAHLQHTYTHILWSCSTLGCAPHESILCFLLFETSWVSLCDRTSGVCRQTGPCGAGEIIHHQHLGLGGISLSSIFHLAFSLSLSLPQHLSVYFCNVIFNFIFLHYSHAYPQSEKLNEFHSCL